MPNAPDAFYEIPADIRELPKLTEVEGDVFDIVNNAGAITVRALINRSASQGYSQADTTRAIGSLVAKGCLARRSIVAE